jgi:hypothetical protein
MSSNRSAKGDTGEGDSKGSSVIIIVKDKREAER